MINISPQTNKESIFHAQSTKEKSIGSSTVRRVIIGYKEQCK